MLTRKGLTLWSIKCISKEGKVLWEIEDQPNIVPDSGEKAIVDTFFRKNDSTYFAADYFYVGLYKGTISESTTLATVPNEPLIEKGYSRQVLERSNVGFPTIEQSDGDWRVVSKEVSFTASGGDIGPVNGAFLSTSEDNSGVLICAVSTPGGLNQTIVAGSTAYLTIKYKQK